jgi:Cu2+-exporting ATPase
MEADFLRRFWNVTVLLVPLLLTTDFGLNLLGLSPNNLIRFIQFGLATLIFYFGLIFFQHAAHEIKHKQYGMMTLVSIAVGSGYLFSAAATFIPALEAHFYLEISTLIWVLLFGHYLEARSSTAAGDALQEVSKLLPETVHLIQKGETQDVPLQELKKGDLVLVKPGEKVPADGRIKKGQSSFNQAHLSGESKPVFKTVGDKVAAGSIAVDGAVRIKVSDVGDSSTVGQIRQLVAKAQQTKPQSQRLADRAARWLTLTSVAIAFATLLVWTLVVGETFVFALTLAITVLVITCPHALGLAIPAVTTIGTGLAVKHGLFIKDLSKLESIRQVDYVVFDKTGTLTKGELAVDEIVSFNDQMSENEVLKIAASLETQSAHVLADAIVKKAKQQNISLTEAAKFKTLPGKGIQGKVLNRNYFLGNLDLVKERKLFQKQWKSQINELSTKGKTLAFLMTDKELLGALALSDQIKPESFEAVAQLHRLGIKAAMITGDSREVAAAVAQQLKIDKFFAGVKPEEKYDYVKQLQDEGHKVIMTGDGVNDAPALTQADVGVAIGAGTDVAVEAGDVVLTTSNPQRVVTLIVLARKIFKKMNQNLWWALGYNIVAIPAAAGVFVPLGFTLRPDVGALLMSLSSVIVVVNAFGLKKADLSVKV